MPSKFLRRVVDLLAERLSSQPSLPTPPPEQKPERKNLPKLCYNLKEVAAELGLSRVSIYRLEARGLIKCVPGIRHKIYSRAEVEQFISGERSK